MLSAALGLRVPRAAAQATDSTASLVGVVVAQGSEEPLPFSIASIPARHLERLANERGEFLLAGLAGGSATVLVRHLGYTPRSLSVTLRPGRRDTIRVELTRLAVQLGAMQVRAARQCTNPGIPKAATDPAFAALFDQLRQNAEQYRVLSEQYPFTYDMQRTSSIRYVGGDVVVQHVDTVRLNTGVNWRYAPGSVVERTSDPRNRQVLFNIPALIHFADTSFLAHHCFFYAGRDTADGVSALRIDFLAASRLKTPDVDGSMYLDPSTYQIRRSVLHLTRIPPETPEISSVDVVTEFRTIVPSISIAASISSVHRLSADTTRPLLPFAAYETQRLLHVTFLDKIPGRPPSPPPERSPLDDSASGRQVVRRHPGDS